jgi:hypothetical protein
MTKPLLVGIYSVRLPEILERRLPQRPHPTKVEGFSLHGVERYNGPEAWDTTILGESGRAPSAAERKRE